MTSTTDLTTLSIDELKKLKKQKEIARNKHDLMQKCQKTALNSLYGALANEHFIFFEIAMAEAITVSGRYVIQKVANDMDAWIKKLTGSTCDHRIAGDTDSVMFNFSPFVEKYFPDDPFEVKIDKIAKFADGPANDEIAKIMAAACDVMNAFEPSAMTMDRESICDAGAFVAKKKYCLSIVDQEGVRLTNKKHKITGLDSKRAVFSQKVRDKIKSAYWDVLHKSEEDLIESVSQFRKEFMVMDVDDIAQVTSVNNIAKYMARNMKGATMNVKAAVSYNEYIKRKGLTHMFSPIESGSKIKMVRLKMPNPTMQPVFAYEGSWSKLFELDDYIDRNDQFVKSFISPLENFVVPLNKPIEPPKHFELF